MKFINKEKIKETTTKITHTLKERKFKYIAFFWIIIAIQFVIGSNLQYKGYSIRNGKDLIIAIFQILWLSIIFIIGHYSCLKLYNKIKEKQNEKQDKTKRINKKSHKKLEKNKGLIYFGIIFLCWIPTLLAFYPSILSYDGGVQIRSLFLFGKAGHHPLMITALYTFFYSIGYNLGSCTFGMLLYSLCQMTFMASMFAYAVRFIEKITKNKAVTIISLIFYAVFPYNQLFSIITTKDVIFAGLFLLFLIKLYEFLETKYKIVDYIFFVLMGVLMLLSRNNTVFTLEVAIPFIIILLLKNKEKLIRIVPLLLIIIILYKNVNTGLYGLANNKNDEGSLRVLMYSQFSAKLALEEKNLTEEEKEKISYYYNDYKELAQKYKPAISDNTVNMANYKNITSDKKEFYRWTISMIKKYPRTFIESSLNTIRGFWYINDNTFNRVNYDKSPNNMGALELGVFVIKPHDNQYNVQGKTMIPWLTKFDKKLFCENKYEKIPIFYMLFQPATYLYITLACILYLLYQKEREKLVVTTVAFIYYGTCFAAPCTTVRYIYPVITAMPLLIGIIFENKKINNEKQEIVK